MESSCYRCSGDRLEPGLCNTVICMSTGTSYIILRSGTDVLLEYYNEAVSGRMEEEAARVRREGRSRWSWSWSGVRDTSKAGFGTFGGVVHGCGAPGGVTSNCVHGYLILSLTCRPRTPPTASPPQGSRCPKHCLLLLFFRPLFAYFFFSLSSLLLLCSFFLPFRFFFSLFPPFLFFCLSFPLPVFPI